MSAANVSGGLYLWSTTTLPHSSFLPTITFLLKKGNSDLCCNEFTGAVKLYFQGAARINPV
jgi:hypothetical protein